MKQFLQRAEDALWRPYESIAERYGYMGSWGWGVALGFHKGTSHEALWNLRTFYVE